MTHEPYTPARYLVEVLSAVVMLAVLGGLAWGLVLLKEVGR